MSDWYSCIDDERKKFIESQHIFFVGTAPADSTGEVNVSPKGRTLMFCSFDAPANIVQLYGHGRAVSLDDPMLVEYRAAFKSDAHPFVRQAFFVDIEKVQTSCGYAVPRMQFLSERDTLDKWCDNRLEPRAMSEGFSGHRSVEAQGRQHRGGVSEAPTPSSPPSSKTPRLCGIRESRDGLQRVATVRSSNRTSTRG